MSVSVIIPAFNAARTLRETLDSLSAQSLPPDEVVVVDDGSTDTTAEIARAVPGVRLVSQANAGAAAALNAGLSVATGAVLAFLDADDLWVPDTVRNQIENLAAQAEADASVGWVEEFICTSLGEAEARRFKARPAQLGWLSGSTFVRADSFRNVGSFDPQAQAWPWIDWAHRAKLQGLKFATLDHVVLKRRLHPSSLSMREGSRGGANLIGAARQALQRRRMAAKE
jgi:glycosyltransferase involved in cell wall biosynthesis